MAEPYETQNAELWYPQSDDRPNRVTVSLIDTRAADDLIVTFDFDRNGWVISMDEVDENLDVKQEAVELAFLPAWNKTGRE